MLIATFHKGSNTIVYWTKDHEMKREYCESQIVAKLRIMEERLKNKVEQKLVMER